MPADPKLDSMNFRRLRTTFLCLAVGALALAACGSGDETDAASALEPAAENDTVTETTETTGETNATDEAATTDDSGPISFSADVQPIIEENCVSCHSNNGPGTTHLEMATAGDVATIADYIAFRVETKQMPPWPISPLTEIAFTYDLSMSDEDRATIVDWEAAGAELDVDADTPLVPSNETFAPIDADVVLTAAEPYPGSDKLDDYRCQVFDPEITSDGWITGFEVRPDETRVLHHSLMFLAEASTRPAADSRDGSDGRPGWECQTIPRLAGGDLSQVAGWAPGTGPVVTPQDAGFPVSPGDFLVVQWHYHYDGEPLPDQTAIALEFASDEEIAAAGGTLRSVDTAILLGPAEIPCATYESGPLCDRDAALARVAAEFGFESLFIPEGINSRCGVSPEDFAHMTDGLASSSCDMRAPRGEVITLWPHMHELGTTYRMTLNPDTPEEKILIDIDRWSFDWQMGYDPVDELVFEAGDVLRIECGWDRALWPAGVESRYVVWAEGTNDEMCYTGVSLVR